MPSVRLFIAAWKALLCGVALSALAGCLNMPEPQSTPVPPPGTASEPEILTAAPKGTLAGEWRATAPAAEEPGCYHEQLRPAVVETVTDHELVSPEERDPATGTVIRPASYRSTTQARIVEGGEKMWFRRVCETELTPGLISTLQRALLARGYYAGAVTGQFGKDTQEAVKAYQSQRGLISPVLSLRAAQQMGLIIWEGSPAAVDDEQAPTPVP